MLDLLLDFFFFDFFFFLWLLREVEGEEVGEDGLTGTPPGSVIPTPPSTSVGTGWWSPSDRTLASAAAYTAQNSMGEHDRWRECEREDAGTERRKT